MEDYLVITTEYYWHWDLKGTGLTVWDYRKMMEQHDELCKFRIILQLMIRKLHHIQQTV